VALLIYALCAMTALAVAVLLLRGFARTRARLLLWSGICFTGLFLNNAVLLVDLHVVPAYDLSLWRSLPALLGLAALLYGLIWETGR
jgi:hypothetical protein